MQLKLELQLYTQESVRRAAVLTCKGGNAPLILPLAASTLLLLLVARLVIDVRRLAFSMLLLLSCATLLSPLYSTMFKWLHL
jgi:hypothetical protein